MNTATLKSVGHAAMRNLLGSFCAVNPNFAIDAVARDVQTGNAIDYCIDGAFYTLATQAAIDVSTLSGLPAVDLATGYTQVYLFQVDAAGTITVKAGEQVSNVDIASGKSVPDVPEPGVGSCAFGMLKVVNTSGSDFVLGTTLLTAAGITETFTSLCRVPASA